MSNDVVKEMSLTDKIRSDILSKITTKVYAEGDRIPTEKQLCQEYGVSRITVQNAILALVNEDLLYRVKGKGTFVNKKRIKLQFMTKDTSFHEQILAMGMVPSTNVLNLEVVEASEHIAQQLCIDPGVMVIRLLRLRYADKEPIAIVESYLPYELCKHVMDYNFTVSSLHDALNDNPDTEISQVFRYVEAIPAGNTEHLLLAVPKGSPIQFFTNYAINDKHTLVEYCVSYYRGDKSRFAVEITRKKNA